MNAWIVEAVQSVEHPDVWRRVVAPCERVGQVSRPRLQILMRLQAFITWPRPALSTCWIFNIFSLKSRKASSIFSPAKLVKFIMVELAKYSYASRQVEMNLNSTINKFMFLIIFFMNNTIYGIDFWPTNA